MIKGKSLPVLMCAVAVSVIISSCTNSDFIRPNPPPSISEQSVVQEEPASQQSDSMLIDFGVVFDSSYGQSDSTATSESADQYHITNDSGKVYMASRKVRVAVLRNTARVTLYSAGNTYIRTGSGKVAGPERGRFLIEAVKTRGRAKLTISHGSFEVTLPCTLAAVHNYNYIDIDNVTYRGMIVLIAGKGGRVTLVNSLGVEEYLRGVVPLELGKRTGEELEALKAQAVAARTYTYKRMSERRSEAFDLVNTVADQVYGGASVEYRVSDNAIKATADQILMYGDSIIYAYYHSTCGGKTATIDHVWDKAYQPYLVSVSDTDPSGKAYCRASTYFTWTEKWTWRSFTSIITTWLSKNGKSPGAITHVNVGDRFSCGRIKTLHINGKKGVVDIEGDKIRFILRRAVKGHPILRSSNFKLSFSGHTEVKAQGIGYGHGVGLCQMGAIGRAQAGQTYREILLAYYSGASLVNVVEREKVLK